MMPLPRSAGNRRINRAEAIERCARLLLASPECGFDHAWRYCAGFEAGRWKRELGHEVLARMVELESSPSA